MNFEMNEAIAVIGTAFIYVGTMVNLLFILCLFLDNKIKYYGILYLSFVMIAIGVILVLSSSLLHEVVKLFSIATSWTALQYSFYGYLLLIFIGYTLYAGINRQKIIIR